MLIKHIIHSCVAATLALSASTLFAETDPDFTDDILTMPRVIVGDTVYQDVLLQLDFAEGMFAVTGVGEGLSRFSAETVGIDEMLVDNINKRSWVNGSHACVINADAAMTASMDAVAYCDSLQFAAHDDWRAATSDEMADMIVNADRLGVQLNYRNPNCQFMATSDGFVQTENNDEPGKFEESAVNSGTRCMREN
ncbi:MAG: hypothetical protein GQ582_11070 [Methyloprofundus sp.]|nr:hypothetical protein [Methyloprofundus sp.]